jgi:hypothetical protein
MILKDFSMGHLLNFELDHLQDLSIYFVVCYTKDDLICQPMLHRLEICEVYSVG